MRDIKAIETRYKGYRFRSRLEARWAVFFDSLGIDWEFEKQGYHLPSLGCYLPDFWLPASATWVEIKGALPQNCWDTTEEESKLYELTALTSHRAFLFYGLPDLDSTPFASFKHRTMGGLSAADMWRGIGVVDFYYWISKFSPVTTDMFSAAMDAAKSARFEFGEEGAR